MADARAELRAAVLSRVTASLDGIAAQAESPIEELVYWALLLRAGEFGPMWAAADNREWGRLSWFRIQGDLADITFFPQCPVEAGGQRYRLDFYAQAEEAGTSSAKAMRFAIECDGHEFHERTKQQAQRDRKRDRDLQAAGYRVLRFTGSEIVRDPIAVAAEIIDAIDSEVHARFSEMAEAHAAAGRDE